MRNSQRTETTVIRVLKNCGEYVVKFFFSVFSKSHMFVS